ncbi:dTDP-4-dehydrorhamnose reductase [Tamilnaduibacter salinus]|uniref:dTDP-4-dehydrorhamnose reductase n=2 Tax=Tamilnaduibacter salinus TaxID=1484056 RepID=A0A2A2I030_9GAMM|nr:dTDP-4-dehydrorhamnose reductase [Tamilnaduibacter salinus]
MRILVTGSDGQIGHELLKTLAPLGEVVGITRADGDLASPEVVDSLMERFRPGVVVNPAAYTAVDQAEGEETVARGLNAGLPEKLARWAEANGALLVHYSTDYVYAGNGEAPMPESEPTAPLSVYGKTKLAGDEAILAHSPSAVILRTSWVYGARGRNFMLTMLKLAAERNELKVVADQWGAPTPAWLIAQVTALVIRARLLGNDAIRGVYHLTCRKATSWCGLAREIIRLAGERGAPLKMGEQRVFPIPTSEYPAPAPRPKNSRLDVSRIEQALAIQLPDWKAALGVTLGDWHKD